MKYKLILFLFISQTMSCQEIKLDNYCFLLGTLDDYMGRSSCMGNTIVDHYDKSEKILVNYIIENLKTEFDDLVMNSTDYLNSPKLAKKINNDFIWEKSEYELCSDKVDSNGDAIDIAYIGKLDWEKVLKTDNQKASYVFGILSRYMSSQDDNLYAIYLPNSFNAFSACVEQLYALECSYVKTEMVESVPFSFAITFTPKERLKLFLENHKELLLRLKKKGR